MSAPTHRAIAAALAAITLFALVLSSCSSATPTRPSADGASTQADAPFRHAPVFIGDPDHPAEVRGYVQSLLSSGEFNRLLDSELTDRAVASDAAIDVIDVTRYRDAAAADAGWAARVRIAGMPGAYVLYFDAKNRMERPILWGNHQG
jgi:hypothetical protein